MDYLYRREALGLYTFVSRGDAYMAESDGSVPRLDDVRAGYILNAFAEAYYVRQF